MNNLNLGIALCFVLACPVVYCQVQKSDRKENFLQADMRKWHAGSYRGLKIGKSTNVDMRRVLGRPSWSGNPYSRQEVWYEYANAGEFRSKIVVIVSRRTKTILSIDLYPEGLSKSKVVEYFGTRYRVTKYAFDDCLGDDEMGPMYESAFGPITFIEYRDRGIAISLDEDKNVKEIRFVRGPIGAPKSKCATRRSKN